MFKSGVKEEPDGSSPSEGGGVSSSDNIAKSAGTSRLNRILDQPHKNRVSYVPDNENYLERGPEYIQRYKPKHKQTKEEIRNPNDEDEVGKYVAKIVIPELKVDSRSIGGTVKNKKDMIQETLVSVKCRNFELMPDKDAISKSALEYPNQYAKHKRSLGFGGGTKIRNKIKYVLLVRSTNSPLLVPKEKDTSDHKKGYTADSDDEMDDEESYDRMFRSEQEGQDDEGKDEETGKEENEEVSSFPVLVCMSLNPDGTNPDVMKLVELDQLTTVQNISAGGATVLQLVFSDGDTVKLDFAVEENPNVTDAPTASMRKERFVWSLLQIHAMLCTSVVERNSLGSRTNQGSSQKDRLLQPLNVRNLDRAELQYVATVNGFLRDSLALCSLLDRQRDIGSGQHADMRAFEEDEKKDEMDGMAYDMMMGNFSTRVAIYHSADERADAEEVLNATHFEAGIEEEDSAADILASKLQDRMKELEAETCMRLIAWEDEKHYSIVGQNPYERESEDAMSLGNLFRTLDLLDKELETMEVWLHDRAAVIKPLTDDCRDIEEENRCLEQQWKSYEVLSEELRRLLTGVGIPKQSEKVLNNPASALVYSADGSIDIEASESGVDKIHHAGKALKEAMENAKKAGGVHLRAVNERVEQLVKMSSVFCTALAQIIVTVMEQIKSLVMVASDNGKVSKSDTHAMIAKKIRDTQRKFQSSLLGYMKLIEILALLKPVLLEAIRDAYSEMVAEGILMKKRMKGYFQALPGKNAAYLNLISKDLKDYHPIFEHHEQNSTVNATDISYALSELLPVIAREAYFTAALFGLSSKQMDGREKKRNFESAKRSVDHSTQYFRYYIQRTCGIVQDVEDPSQLITPKLKGDPMLSLVASIHLNEAMEQYIDREKKGGDHSLSLAYVRATILGLRKKVDKQWVEWIEEQIEWIKSHPGVPLNGKRAGIFASFARFPTYLDHILLCCREGKPTNYTPDFSSIQVVSYYLQKLAGSLLESLRQCSERETTDQQYAANVMRMENSYHFSQQIKDRGPEISTLFSKQLAKSSAICKQSTDAYLGWMIKREFKALHTLFSQISRIRRDVGDKDVPIHIPRATFVKTLQKESNREVMKEKIATIYARMEKHLSEEGKLLPVAWKALVKVLYEWFGRWEKLSTQCYKHVLEPSAVDVVRLAKQKAGGSAINKQKFTTAIEAIKIANQQNGGKGQGNSGMLMMMGKKKSVVA